MAKASAAVTTSTSKKHGTVRVRCNCKSDFQDALYGSGVRLGNLMVNGKALARCTVCSSLHQNAAR